ncbi:acetyl coenzyme A synthetase (ADP forming), alpha domain [Hartmannibacter diazotrophicus]|uniref:Acetyl coenzyme A synthetase (ADP forming), alpha domain n=1 Tax=Hartmannibacter diazotrophicus TaxID=1482074 RepID=A0A2C9D6M3_9HYPH|nr:CoA-binding protein [Hartmannibacter diazotrophicus]SON55972.1 acetyl coenzyme A synthetase (ADP forming), alpha domain [Hartmannibacter diazotrophicus]
MNHDDYSDAYIRSILSKVKTIAVVGASNKEERPSFVVSRFMAGKGYKVYAVNPGLPAGSNIDGAPVVARLADVPEPIDMVDVFRNSEAAAGVVDEALALDPLPKVIWMQLEVRHDEAAKKAEAAGIEVVMDRCPKIEIMRLEE